MSNPIEVMESIHASCTTLDEIGKQLADANQRYMQARRPWFEHYDAVAADLEDEHRERGSKRDPSEHLIESTARRQNRALYHEFHDAEKELKNLQAQAEVVSSALSGKQSEMNALRDEMRAVGAAR